jgi:hypothetical protein
MKQNKPSTLPDRYTEIKLIKKQHTLRKVIIDTLGKFHSYKDAESKVDPTVTIDKEFQSFDDFDKQGKQTILAYHEQFFKQEPQRKQPLNTTALMCWMYMLSEAAPHVEGTDPVTGKRERKSSIAGRRYSLGTSAKPGSYECPGILTYQAVQCHRIFIDTLAKNESVTESDLKAEITRRAPELKTKQDPWRIFQYYRPKLIAAKLIKHD